MRRVLACGLLLAATVMVVPAGPAHADGLRTSVFGDSVRGDQLEARRAEQGRNTTSSDDEKGDGGWLVAGFAAIALGAGAFVAWRAFGRTDAPE